MNDDDLQRLIMAVRENDPKWYNGDVKEATVEALEELADFRRVRDELKDVFAGC